MPKYDIHIHWSEDEQAYIAEAPELPGCAAKADTAESALESLQHAVGLWVAAARKLGRELPAPTTRREHFLWGNSRVTVAS